MFDRRVKEYEYELPADHDITTAVQRLIHQTLPHSLSATNLFMKSSTIYSSLDALFNLIFLLCLASLHQISVTSPKLRQKAILEEDCASMHCSTWTRTQFHLLACLHRYPVEDCRLARVFTNSIAQQEKVK